MTEALSIEVLSDEISISPFHFARMFKQFTGLSPH
ncbi:MAG: AraC family transcriptional regulator [Leptolyngbya sp. BL-A-14]